MQIIMKFISDKMSIETIKKKEKNPRTRTHTHTHNSISVNKRQIQATVPKLR